MESKLNKDLDEIIKTRNSNSRGRGFRGGFRGRGRGGPMRGRGVNRGTNRGFGRRRFDIERRNPEENDRGQRRGGQFRITRRRNYNNFEDRGGIFRNSYNGRDRMYQVCIFFCNFYFNSNENQLLLQ